MTTNTQHDTTMTTEHFQKVFFGDDGFLKAPKNELENDIGRIVEYTNPFAPAEHGKFRIVHTQKNWKDELLKKEVDGLTNWGCQPTQKTSRL